MVFRKNKKRNRNQHLGLSTKADELVNPEGKEEEEEYVKNKIREIQDE